MSPVLAIRILIVVIALAAWGALGGPAAADPPAADAPETEPATLDAVLAGMEKRYEGSGFSAQFDQESTVAAMDIIDRASGRLWVKSPGMMRWEYETPEPQVIVTNGKTLWVYRPVDNQVMLGSAPLMFDEGRGAGFLSDVSVIRDRFEVALVPSDDPGYYHLGLVPRGEGFDITRIDLFVSRQTHDIHRIISRNAYGDETRIYIGDYRFDLGLTDERFTFEIPEGADVVRLEE